jgi:phosphinothricin acetyltransferase
MSGICIEVLGPGDIEAARRIYNHYVETSTATFHTDPVSTEEFVDLVLFDDARYRTFAIRVDGTLVGYGLAGAYKSRCAYGDASEVAVYLAPDATRKGLGPMALDVIEEHAREVGLHVLIAGVCTENEASLRLFIRAGYEPCAHFRQVGNKFGRRLDVRYFQKILG